MGQTVSEALNAVEIDLRSLIRLVLGESWKDISQIDIRKLEEKRAAEVDRRRGTRVSMDLLDYVEFYHFRTIMLGNSVRWELFMPALKEKKVMEVYLSRLESFRNPTAHSRDLQPFEKSLVLGMTGEIRQLITMHRSSVGEDRLYYPVLESVSDNFGNTGDGDADLVETHLRIDVGGEVTFSCRATDSQGRRLTWSADNFTNAFQHRVQCASGEVAELVWKVSEADVGEQCDVVISVTAEGRFHRLQEWDAYLTFRYAVRPPVQ